MRCANAVSWLCAGVVVAGACTAGVSVSPDAATRPGGPTTNAPPTGLGPTGSDPVCGLKTFALTRVTPDLLVILDRSASMGERAPSQTTTKWEDMTAAINLVVGKTQTAIRWGLKYFPVDNICAVDEGAAVAVAPMNAGMIDSSIGLTAPGGRTPTRLAVQNGAAYLASLKDANPKYILLATDGQPNCQDPGVGVSIPDDARTVQAVADAATLGIPTFVIGVATTGDPSDLTLSQMAIAGLRARADEPRYYPVGSKDSLVATLGLIGSQIASCTFALGSRPPDPSNIAVSADGTRVTKDTTHGDGWDYGAGEMSIQLFGGWCDRAKDGTIKDVKAIFGCPGVVIP